MRKLQTKDAFNAMRLIKKANIREDIKPVLKMAATGNLKVEEIGLEGMLVLIESMTSEQAEKAIYEFLSGPFELEPEKIQEMDMKMLTEKIKEMGKDEGLKDFFSFLSGLITLKH